MGPSLSLYHWLICRGVLGRTPRFVIPVYTHRTKGNTFDMLPSLAGCYPHRTGAMSRMTALHIYPMLRHLVEASYAYRAANGPFGASRCIRVQFLGYGFPRRPLLGDS
jgi:hypothetical protein